MVKEKSMEAFALVLLLLSAVSALGIVNVKQIQQRLDGMVRDNVYKMELVQEIADSIHRLSSMTRTLILLDDPLELEEELKKIAQARAQYGKALSALENTPTSQESKAMQDKIKEAMIAARPLNQKVIDLAMENRDNEATEALLRESAPAIRECQDLLDQYSNRENQRNKQDAESASKAYETARGLVLFMSAIAIVLGAAAATLITHGLLRSSAGSQAMRQRSPQVSRPATSISLRVLNNRPARSRKRLLQWKS